MHPPVRSSAMTAMAEAPNSRKTGERMSGEGSSLRKPDPSILRLYSAIMEMVPLRLVRSCWMGGSSSLSLSLFVVVSPAVLLVASSLEDLAVLIFWRRASTDSEGPSWQYWRTSASLALRTKTPMAWREVEE